MGSIRPESDFKLIKIMGWSSLKDKVGPGAMGSTKSGIGLSYPCVN